MPEYKDWLRKVPDDSTKYKCMICQIIFTGIFIITQDVKVFSSFEVKLLKHPMWLIAI